jgi:hypothetical protein
MTDAVEANPVKAAKERTARSTKAANTPQDDVLPLLLLLHLFKNLKAHPNVLPLLLHLFKKLQANPNVGAKASKTPQDDVCSFLEVPIQDITRDPLVDEQTLPRLCVFGLLAIAKKKNQR